MFLCALFLDANYSTHNISISQLLFSPKSGLYAIRNTYDITSIHEILMEKALKLIREKMNFSSQVSSISHVGVVIPTLNEEKNIEDVLLNLKKQGYYNILVIDGMSKDRTTMIAARNGVKVILQNGRGKG